MGADPTRGAGVGFAGTGVAIILSAGVGFGNGGAGGVFCAGMSGNGVSVGVGDAERERLYFICPNATEPMNDDASVTRMIPLTIRRVIFLFRLPIAKPKLIPLNQTERLLRSFTNNRPAATARAIKSNQVV